MVQIKGNPAAQRGCALCCSCRFQLKQQADAVSSAAVAESAAQEIKAKLEEQESELARLQSEWYTTPA